MTPGKPAPAWEPPAPAPPRRVLWLPGDFPSTNKLLDAQRASGFYAGAGQARGLDPRERPPLTSYSHEVSRIRTWTFAHAKRNVVRAELPRLARLKFIMLGRGRYDPSAWYLSAKAVEDGLIDARLLASDRSDVLETAGRSVTDEETARLLAEAFNVPRRARERGMIVVIEGVSDGAL